MSAAARVRARATLHAADYRELARLLHDWTGIRLQDKQYLVEGRLRARLDQLGLPDFSEYARVVRDGGRQGREAQAFINALTTNKTSFFREPHHFDYLVKQVFASAKQRAHQGQPKRLRLWSAACSRGAEPYTMALLAAHHLPASQGWDVRILATDLDTEVLAEATEGVYAPEELSAVAPELRRTGFTRMRDGRERVRDEVRALVTFAKANLVARPFPVKGRFEAIFCRNVMIYFDRATQEALVAELLGRLGGDGVLIVGHSESLLGMPVARDERGVGVYRAIDAKSPTSGATLANERIVLGQWRTSATPMWIATLLGSCVAACLWDPEAGVGGMNHFLLPRAGDDAGSARYGVHAMELLINELLERGASRARLQAKAFGAGNVNRALRSEIAPTNERFIRDFLARESIPLVASRMGGDHGREVAFHTATGEARVRAVPIKGGGVVAQELGAWNRAVVEESATQPFNPDDALF